MAITSQDHFVEYVITPGEAGRLDYPFAFGAKSAADIVCLDIDAAGNATELSPNEYTVTPSASGIMSGGNVRLAHTFPVGHTLRIQRQTPLTQSKVFLNQNRIPPPEIEDGLDRAIMIAQELHHEVGKQGGDIEQVQEGLAKEIIDRTSGDNSLAAGVEQARQEATAVRVLAQEARNAAVAARQAADEAEKLAKVAEDAAAAVDGKADVTEFAKYLPLTGGTMTGGLDMRSNIYLGLHNMIFMDGDASLRIDSTSTPGYRYLIFGNFTNVNSADMFAKDGSRVVTLDADGAVSLKFEVHRLGGRLMNGAWTAPTVAGTVSNDEIATTQHVTSKIKNLAQPLLNDSFTEQFTGRYWVNGKKIYQKTIDCGLGPNVETKLIPTNIENGDRVVGITGIALGHSGLSFVLPYVNPDVFEAAVSLYTTMSDIWISSKGNVLAAYGCTVYVTLLYTCNNR